MILVLIGEDLFSKEQEIAKFLESSLKERKDDPLARKIIFATDTNLASVAGEIMQSCDTTSLFAEEQTVIVRRAESLKAADQKALASWISTSPSCNLCFEFQELPAKSELRKALKKAEATILTFDAPKPWEREKWITNLCNSHFKKSIEPAAAYYIAETLGSDTANIASELEKILQHSPDIKTFSESLVKEFIVLQREISPFEIQDSFGNRDAKAYTKKLHELITQGVDGNLIVAILLEYAIKLLHTSTMLDAGMTPEEIAAKLGVNSFIFCKKSNEPRRARLWGRPLLCRVIKRLGELNVEFKNGKCASKISQELTLASLVIPPK